MAIAATSLTKINRQYRHSAVTSRSKKKSTRWCGRSAGAPTPVMTLHRRNIHTTREWIIRIPPVPIGTVPISRRWRSATAIRCSFTWDSYRDTLIEQCEQGVDYFTIHAGVRSATCISPPTASPARVARRSIMAKWCSSPQGGFLYTHF